MLMRAATVVQVLQDVSGMSQMKVKEVQLLGTEAIIILSFST